jgi:hypothetical protein
MKPPSSQNSSSALYRACNVQGPIPTQGLLGDSPHGQVLDIAHRDGAKLRPVHFSFGVLAFSARTKGFLIVKSTVQKHFIAHGLGKPAQRLARAAAIAAATTRLLTEAASKDEPLGFYLTTGGPGRSSASIRSTSASPRSVQGVPAHRHRRLHPLAFVAIVFGPSTELTPCVSWTRLAPTAVNGVRVRAILSDNAPNTWPAPLSKPWERRRSSITGSLPARPPQRGPQTLPRHHPAPSSRSAGARPSIAGASPRFANSRPKPTLDP